jgi:OOP family OmpA-OmpF porin
MKKTFIALAATTLLAFAATAQAQGYVGVAGGPSNLDTDCSGTVTCDKSGTGFKVYGGYKFMPFLAGEVTYMSFGKAKASVDFGGSLATAEIKTTGFGAGVAFTGDLAPNWPASARIGVARMKADVSGSAFGIPVSESDNTTQAYFGLDVGYAFTKNMAVTLSLDYSRSEFDGAGDPVRLIGVGFKFSF